MEDNNLEKQREQFLKQLEEKDKELDKQLEQLDYSKEQIHLPQVEKKILTPEEQKKKFLDELDRKSNELDKELNKDIKLTNSQVKTQKSKELVKFHLYKNLIGAVLVVFVLVIISKIALNMSYKDNLSQTTNHNVNQVKIALINYYKEQKKLPINKDSLINTKELISKKYLSTDVEEQCDCKFYLKDDKKSVIAIPNSQK